MQRLIGVIAVAVAVVIQPLIGGAHEPARYAGTICDSNVPGAAESRAGRPLLATACDRPATGAFVFRCPDTPCSSPDIPPGRSSRSWNRDTPTPCSIPWVERPLLVRARIPRLLPSQLHTPVGEE